MPRIIVIEMLDSGACTAKFGSNGEDHFTKRELMRVIRTIKQESKQQVRMYRRNQKLKGPSNGKRVQTGESESGASDSSEGSKETETAGAEQSSSTRVAETAGRNETRESSLEDAIARAKERRIKEAASRAG